MKTFLMLLLLPLISWGQSVKFGEVVHKDGLIIVGVDIVDNPFEVWAISLKIGIDTTRFQYVGGNADPYLLQHGIFACNQHGGYLLAGWYIPYPQSLHPVHVMDWYLRPLRNCGSLDFALDLSEIAGAWGYPIPVEWRDTTICNEKPNSDRLKSYQYNVLGQRIK